MNAGLGKVCEVEDFAAGPTADTIREVFAHELERFGPGFPASAAYRKHWEVAMAVRALRETGVLRPGATVLGVGAGNEPTLFWLTRDVTVHATDLYLDGSAWAESANGSMLVDPGRHWPGPWVPERLVVQHMDARALRYQDASFDAVFSSSSLEHFGTDAEIACSLDELCRVLKPGGVCSLSTEMRLGGDLLGLPDIRMFTAEELVSQVVGDRDWALVDGFDATTSTATRDAIVPFADAAADVRAHVAEHGDVVFHRLTFSQYPHIALSEGELQWTSAHVALRKGA